ncbi:MAG: HDOD domain-containing protein [Steroidobacteraceae bacterium]
MSAEAASPQGQSAQSAAFEFVRSLSVELSGGRVELPSFPDVAVRVRRALADESSTVDQVVRIVGSEPALAARLLKMANSALLNRSGKQVTDLRTAVNRMGHNMVRSAAISFAMAQIRAASKLKGLEKFLEDLWESSTQVAAMSFVLASRLTKLNPDEAMLAGLLHGIGKLYIVTRAEKHPILFMQPEAMHDMIRDWHAAIGKAILENWEFSESMAEAIASQDDLARETEDPPNLTDVIAAALLISSFATDPKGLEAAMQGSPVIDRLRLNGEKATEIMRESANEIASLRSALKG